MAGKIESVNIEYNDDNTLSLRIHPKRKKAKNGEVTYMDSVSMTAASLGDAVKKIEKFDSKGGGKDSFKEMSTFLEGEPVEAKGQ